MLTQLVRPPGTLLFCSHVALHYSCCLFEKEVWLPALTNYCIALSSTFIADGVALCQACTAY